MNRYLYSRIKIVLWEYVQEWLDYTENLFLTFQGIYYWFPYFGWRKHFTFSPSVEKCLPFFTIRRALVHKNAKRSWQHSLKIKIKTDKNLRMDDAVWYWLWNPTTLLRPTSNWWLPKEEGISFFSDARNERILSL